jgi:hypothetical protein
MKPWNLQTIYETEVERHTASILFKIIVALLAAYGVVIGTAIFWADNNGIAITSIAILALSMPLGLLFRGHLRVSKIGRAHV